MKYRKKPVVIEATQWFENGDHPEDKTKRVKSEETGSYFWSEGKVVRHYRDPELSGELNCSVCGNQYHIHGWIDTMEGGHIVCPGDWIITGVKGEHYPCKPDIFKLTYEVAE
jgi:hypothetical protein